MVELSRDDVLPCDVLIAPGTIIRAGCNVSTLLLCLGNRVGREIAKLGPRGEVQAPQAVSVPETDEAPLSRSWRALVKELADDLEEEIENRRAGDLPRRIERDLEIVRTARKRLSAAPAAATREGKE